MSFRINIFPSVINVFFVYFSIVIIYLTLGALTSFDKPVKSNNYIIEGWQSRAFLEETVRQIDVSTVDTFYIIGMDRSKYYNPYKIKEGYIKYKSFVLYGEGIATFDLPTNILSKNNQITLNFRGEAVNQICPHFILKVNQQKIASGFVTPNDSCYSFQFSKPASDSLHIITIEFDNDSDYKQGNDRNLEISNIKINNTPIESLAVKSYYFYTIGKNLRIYISPSRNSIGYLTDLGVDSNRIKLIPLNYIRDNKTKAIAQGAERYFASSTIRDLNIITSEGHSRRSYINFHNCLAENNIDVGCISVTAPQLRDDSMKRKIYLAIDKRVSLVGTWAYWTWKKHLGTIIPKEFLHDIFSITNSKYKAISNKIHSK